MQEAMRQFGLTRRQVLVVGAAAASAALVAPGAVRADAAGVDRAIRAVIGDRPMRDGRIALDLPQIAENGNTVPIEIRVDSPMTADDYVRHVHVFADGNPLPNVVSFHFTPACGEATAATRIRLAGSQTVLAVAEMSDGSIYRAAREITVTIGGCGA